MYKIAVGVMALVAWTGPSANSVHADLMTAEETADWSFQRVGSPMTLNSSGRGIFANVLLDGDTVITTYQTANAESLTDGKSLYYRTFNRDLEVVQTEDHAIDVDSTEYMDWKGDLGDHKLLLLDESIYMVAIVREQPQAVAFKFGKDFSYQAGPSYFGSPDQFTESHLDMGWGTDGENLYAQFFSQPANSPPADWGAAIYRLNLDLTEDGSAIVQPETGSFVTGTSIVSVPAGQMGVNADRLQIFSTNRDYGNSLRVGIHTFASDMDLELIEDSTRDIVVAELDTYFPVGPSYNTKHQLWVVGYTMENEEGEHGMQGKSQELGPSFITIFDAEWSQLQTIQLNNNDPAFRVMTQTEGDDIYIVYDEMDVNGAATVSRARIERYRISVPEPAFLPFLLVGLVNLLLWHRRR